MEANIIELNKNEIAAISGGSFLLGAELLIIWGVVSYFSWPETEEIEDPFGLGSPVIDTVGNDHGYYLCDNFTDKALALTSFAMSGEVVIPTMLLFGGMMVLSIGVNLAYGYYRG